MPILDWLLKGGPPDERTILLHEIAAWRSQLRGQRVSGTCWEAWLLGEHEQLADSMRRYLDEAYPGVCALVAEDLGTSAKTPDPVTLVLVPRRAVSSPPALPHPSLLAEAAATGVMVFDTARVLSIVGAKSDPALLVWRVTCALSHYAAMVYLALDADQEPNIVCRAYAQYIATMLYHTRGWCPWYRTLDLNGARQYLAEFDLSVLLQRVFDPNAVDVASGYLNIACLFMVFLHEFRTWSETGRAWLQSAAHTSNPRHQIREMERIYGSDIASLSGAFRNWLHARHSA